MLSYQTILVVEDQIKINKILSDILQNNGYITHSSARVKESIQLLKETNIDLLLLDLELDDGSGMDILKFVRRQNNIIPVIIISNITNLDIMLSCFKEGTDDYLTKPFYPEEVLVRVQRALNRSKQSNSKALVSQITSGDFTIDYTDASIHINGRIITMRKKLFQIMEHFIKNESFVIHKEILYNMFWKNGFQYDENTLSVHIHQLRKLIDLNIKPSYIQTVHGIGFIFSCTKKKSSTSPND